MDSDEGSARILEMAGYHQGSEVPPETAPPQHCGVPWLLPERAHSLGECVQKLCTHQCCVNQMNDFKSDLLRRSLKMLTFPVPHI